jgi:hypothetical protein
MTAACIDPDIVSVVSEIHRASGHQIRTAEQTYRAVTGTGNRQHIGT